MKISYRECDYHYGRNTMSIKLKMKSYSDDFYYYNPFFKLVIFRHLEIFKNTMEQ